MLPTFEDQCSLPKRKRKEKEKEKKKNKNKSREALPCSPNTVQEVYGESL